MTSSDRAITKVALAIAGTAAILFMGVWAVAHHHERSDVAWQIRPPNESAGQTSTEITVPAAVATTAFARPTLKAVRPNGF
jgi:hypothetical protein